eukprot:Awhi_evm1s682
MNHYHFSWSWSSLRSLYVLSIFLYFISKHTILGREVTQRNVETTWYPVENFAGLQWESKTCNQVCGPGGNFFSNEPKQNMYVDEDGYLYLSVSYNNGRWESSELIGKESFGYGTYSINIIDASHDFFDKNVVLGFFTYSLDETDHHKEIDIEFSSWSDDDYVAQNEVGQFVIQPYEEEGNMFRFAMNNGVKGTTHSFTWSKDKIEFKSTDANGSLSKEWTNPKSITPTDEKIRLNFWQFRGLPPSDGRTQWVKLDFKYIPPAPASSENTLELASIEDRFEEGFDILFSSSSSDPMFSDFTLFDIFVVQDNWQLDHTYESANLDGTKGQVQTLGNGHYKATFYLNARSASKITITARAYYKASGIHAWKTFPRLTIGKPSSQHICHPAFSF